MRIILFSAVMLALTAIIYAQSMRPDLEPMPDSPGQTWVEIGGKVYGAVPDDLGPIGGGEGYAEIITEGDYSVTTVDELREALASAQAGQVVYVDPAGDYDCTTLIFAEKFVIEIPAGVTLASNRGDNGSRGAVIYSNAYATLPLVRALGPNVRMTGIWLRGPNPKTDIEHHRRSFSTKNAEGVTPGHTYYYKVPTSQGISTKFSGLQVDNCELSGWSCAAIALDAGLDHHIHHNYIHHNQYMGLGYGVSHGYGEESASLIDYNLFSANRHSIAGTGKPGNAYEACNNVALQTACGHVFDMHGGRDRGDGTNIAGDWVNIHNNIVCVTDQRAIAIRGVSQDQSFVQNNWFYHAAPASNVMSPWPCDAASKITFEDNAYGAQSPTAQ